MTIARRVMAVALVAAAAQAWAQGAGDYAKREWLDRLATGEDLRASRTGKTGAFSFQPTHAAATAIADDITAEKPDVVVEALFIWKKPFAAKDETLLAYNVLRAVGTLEGIEYYSASRKKMRLFYEKSYRIGGLRDKTRIPDAAVASVPASETLYVFQKDLSFGENVNRYDYRAGTDWIALETTNETAMGYGIVPVAGAGKVKTRILAIRCDEGILFWVCSSAKATVVPGVRGKLQDSFGNRAEAVFNWFAARAQAAWESAGPR